MKRVLLSVIGTVAAVVALLSFKTHGQVATASGGLPSAAVTSTAAPPDPSPTKKASSTTKTTTKTGTPTSVSYVGAAEQTRYGIVQVKITVRAKKITNVSFVQLTAFDGRSQQINAGAAPVLLQETLKAQSAHVNSVSGASYTSQGYVQSLQSALDKAGI
jgi:uncharacterized protein with FMN-binding domain